jgi:hypothetical protein
MGIWGWPKRGVGLKRWSLNLPKKNNKKEKWGNDAHKNCATFSRLRTGRVPWAKILPLHNTQNPLRSRALSLSLSLSLSRDALAPTVIIVLLRRRGGDDAENPTVVLDAAVWKLQKQWNLQTNLSGKKQQKQSGNPSHLRKDCDQCFFSHLPTTVIVVLIIPLALTFLFV